MAAKGKPRDTNRTPKGARGPGGNSLPAGTKTAQVSPLTWVHMHPTMQLTTPTGGPTQYAPGKVTKVNGTNTKAR